MAQLDKYIIELEDNPIGMMAVANAIQEPSPLYWEFLDLPHTDVTSADLIANTQEICHHLFCNCKVHHTPYGKMICSNNQLKPPETAKAPVATASKVAPKLGNHPNNKDNHHVGIIDGPKVWTRLIVIDLKTQPWELLMSSALLSKLNIQLMMPAMLCQMVKHGFTVKQNSMFTLYKPTDDSDTKEAPDLPTSTDYEAVADTINANEIDAVSKPIEMCTDKEV
ncbi:hypothetical protein GGI07_003548, partial [Coemansia sp. Benny D115]